MARTTRGKRILAALGIAILTASGIGGAAHAAPAQSRSATYTAPTGSYHFVYPATWTLQHPKNLDVALVAPDGNVLVVVSSFSGTTTDPKPLLATFAKALHETPFGKARYRTYHLANGLPLQWAGTVVREKNGQIGLLNVEFVCTGGRTYWLFGQIDNVQAGTRDQDINQLTGVTSTFSVAPASGQ